MQNAKSKSSDLHLTSSCLHHLSINPIQSTPSPSSHLLHQHNPSPQTPSFSLSRSKIDGRNPGPLLLIFFINTIPHHKPHPSHSLDLKSMAETLAPFFSSSSFSPLHHLLSPLPLFLQPR